jgi:hypothetical protein
MTLYNHVADRADLDLLVVEAVMAEVALPAAHGDWRAEVEEIATALWRAVRAHPGAVPLILTRRSHSPAVLDLAEALLGALARSGHTGPDLLVAFRAVTAFVAGFAQAELTSPIAAAAGEPAAEVIERIQALPQDRYPRLVEIATAARDSDPEIEFRTSLRRLMVGLEG